MLTQHDSVSAGVGSGRFNIALSIHVARLECIVVSVQRSAIANSWGQ